MTKNAIERLEIECHLLFAKAKGITIIFICDKMKFVFLLLTNKISSNKIFIY